MVGVIASSIFQWTVLISFNYARKPISTAAEQVIEIIFQNELKFLKAKHNF